MISSATQYKQKGKTMKTKLIYNPSSIETINERRTFGGNPDGMLNFTKVKYAWATNLWDTMEANTWFN